MKRVTNIISGASINCTSISLAVLSLLLVFGAGCSSPQTAESAAMATAIAESQAEQKDPERLVLREGDTIRINFPAAPNLNELQAIRRDGKISLQLVGEVDAAGLTPTELERRLLEVYGPQLQTKEVTVSLQSSAFPVYVTGAVLRPGKVVSDRPLTALEAVMEAGGFDYNRANTKKVRVLRYQNGQQQNFVLNLRALMAGKQTEPFKLKPSDILYVPERFAWF